MRILHSWLREYLPLTLSPEKLADRLSMLGLEVESADHLAERYRGLVVGRVISCDPHPNADRLSVCMVNMGKETARIVCGAPNAAAGQNVVVAPPGTTLPRPQSGEDDAPITIAVRTVRGVESRGMICSEYELDLGRDADGILVLDDDARAGQRLTDYMGLDDVAYELEITANRPDWLSHFGVAKEIGLITGRKPRLPKVSLHEGDVPIRRFLSVKVDDTVNCPRFAARMIRGVRVGPSPRWLRNRLRNAGFRPINNVVDATNYVMLEYGHPLHAFDYALLRGGAIVVRQARPGSRFATLDGKEHTLPEGAVMVCDAEREVSIAGIMGGLNSEINADTVDVVLEAAYWNPSSIRRTAKALGISTDASQRFERGADPNGVSWALARVAQLVTELAGGTLLKGTLDVYPRRTGPRRVLVRQERIRSILGLDLPAAGIVRILRALDFAPAPAGRGRYRCTVPTVRVDIEREIDVVEEIARVYGYDRIPENTRAVIDVVQPYPRGTGTDRLRVHLASAGYQETITNSMHDEWRAGLSGLTPVRLLNPLSQEMAFLRTSLVPGLVDVVNRNINFGNSTLRIFEIGHVFTRDPGPHRISVIDGYHEWDQVAVAMTGRREPVGWNREEGDVDFHDLKGAIEALLREFSLDKWRLISYSTSNGLTDNPLLLEIQGGYAGYLGRVRDSVLERFGVRQQVFVAEIAATALQGEGKKFFTPLPKFPRVRRDIALTVDSGTPAVELEAAIRDGAGDLLQGLLVFDVFEDASLGAGKKSLAFALDLMSRDRTLTDQEIDQVVRAAVREAERRCGATLRGTPGAG